MGNELILWPAGWPEHYAGTEPCDMLQGPCACGGWHSLAEWHPKEQKYQKAIDEMKENQ